MQFGNGVISFSPKKKSEKAKLLMIYLIVRFGGANYSELAVK